MAQIQLNLPLFEDALGDSKRYRQSKPNESRFLNQYYTSKFIPYIRNIIKENPGITYEDLEKRLKIDVTELSETIFEARDAYHHYLGLLSRNYLLEHPDKIDYYLNLIKDPRYDTFEKLQAAPEYQGTFEGDILNYLLEIVPPYMDDYEAYVRDLPDDYYDRIQEQLRRGIDPKTVYDNISKQYKKDYNFNYVTEKNFKTAARVVIFGFPEYLKTDEAYIKSDIKASLINSITKLYSQLSKFGFIDASKEIRKNQLERLGLSELASKLSEKEPTSDSLRGSLRNSFYWKSTCI